MKLFTSKLFLNWLKWKAVITNTRESLCLAGWTENFPIAIFFVFKHFDIYVLLKKRYFLVIFRRFLLIFGNLSPNNFWALLRLLKTVYGDHFLVYLTKMFLKMFFNLCFLDFCASPYQRVPLPGGWALTFSLCNCFRSNH